MIKQRRDKNETEIVRLMRAVGAGVRRMDKSAGHDLTVFFRGVVYIVEIKNPDELWVLTENEQNVRDLCEMNGVTYWIIEYEKDARDMLRI